MNNQFQFYYTYWTSDQYRKRYSIIIPFFKHKPLSILLTFSLSWSYHVFIDFFDSCVFICMFVTFRAVKDFRWNWSAKQFFIRSGAGIVNRILWAFLYCDASIWTVPNTIYRKSHTSNLSHVWVSLESKIIDIFSFIIHF